MKRTQIHTYALLLVGCIFLLSGCNGQTTTKPVPVSGRVTWNGEPLTEGIVGFFPAPGQDLSQVASGNIDQDGNYQLMTFLPGDGVIPGDYRITVSAFELVSVDGQERESRILPNKYYRAEESGLTARIESDDGPQSIDLELEGNR